MDVDAPPPFLGMHEEPPDPNDMQIGLDDEEDEHYDDSSYDVDNFPLPSEPLPYNIPTNICHPPTLPPFLDPVTEIEPPISTEELTQKSEELPTTTESVLNPPEIITNDEDCFPELTQKSEELLTATENVLNPPEVINNDKDCFAAPSTSKDTVDSVEENDDFGEDDDFGDFADFSSAPVPVASSQNCNAAEDDWGEFGSPGPLSSGLSKSISIERTEEDDEFWGEFSETTPKPAETDDSEWAADFNYSASVPVHKDSTELAEQVETLEDLIDDDSLWNSYDDCSSLSDESKVVYITDVLDSDEFNDLPEFHSSFDLWKLLRIVEDADALKFEWKDSHVNSNLLKHLKINQVVVRKPESSSITGSTILQPTPIQLAKQESSDAESNALPSPTTAHIKESVSSSQPPLNNGNVASTSVESVPPADFDWDDSGLTNPMNGAARSSALLDIDFLSANSSSSTSAASNLQRDLEEFGLTSSASHIPQTSSVLDDLLLSAGVNSSMPKYKPVSELSLDAKALHDQLPDIEYLRSKIIMFPLGGIGDSFSG